jgi:formylglycine-generating enzyme required for sulfatase activity
MANWTSFIHYGGPMVDDVRNAGEKLKVFISYSRKDSTAFVDELVLGLEDRGFEPILDRHDIKPGEDWEERLGGLIEQSDTVVFVVSPEAVKSERCDWEIDKTLALSKRLLPAIYKPPDTEIPPKLSKLQFVRFDTAPGIMRPLRELADALRADLNWIREHTRLGELATRWNARNRPESLLLRGDDLDASKVWIAKRTQAAPAITEAQRTFIAASEDAERLSQKVALRRTRRVQALVGGLAVAIAAVLAAWLYESELSLWLHEQELRLKKYLYWFTRVRDQVLTAEAERALKPGKSFWDCVMSEADYSKYCPEMVVIPPGKFMMGAPSNVNRNAEHPQHEVVIPERFAVSRFEATFDQWDECVASGPCNVPGGPPDAPPFERARLGKDEWGRGEQPAINVSWDDAQQYVKWLSEVTGQKYRLLSEAEWEYAARARSTSTYSFGDDPAVIGEYAWYNRNSGLKTHPVDDKERKQPNGFGLYDMHGNVMEWVEDCWNNNYNGAPSDGSAWTTGDCRSHVVRGGSWAYSPDTLYSAFRITMTSYVHVPSLGFRIGRTLLPP